MTRPATKYLAILVVIGLSSLGLLFRALLANHENGRSRHAEVCAAPEWTSPLQSESPTPISRPKPPRASSVMFETSQPNLRTPTILREATKEVGPELAEDKLSTELIAVQTEIARAQFQIRMLESKGQNQEASERKSSLQGLQERAAALREQVGLNSQEPRIGPDQP
jgi:hypothetical protein